MNDSSVRTCCCVVLCMLLSVVMGITLGGCGSDSPAGPGGGGGQQVVIYDHYVDAVSGSDSNAGTDQAPFKTISHALSVAVAGDSIKVAPGTYDAALGESFPIQIPDSVALIGDETNRGKGSAPTEIRGQGPIPSVLSYTAAILGGHGSRIAGFLVKAEVNAVLRFGVHSMDVDFTVANSSFEDTYGGIRLAGMGNPVVIGCSFSTGSYGVYDFCDGFSTIQNNEFLSGSLPVDINTQGSVLVYGNLFATNNRLAIKVQQGSPTIDSNTFTGVYSQTYGAVLLRSSSKLRNNHFDVESGPCIVIKYNATPDLGTAADPGGNVFAGAGGVAIRNESSNWINAIGNTWHSSSPACGTEIIAVRRGVVAWGTGSQESCPVSSGESGSDYSFYVSALSGDDANAGTEQAPFKTITKAMSVAQPDDSVKVNPGTYDIANGEVFPIQIPDGVSLIGDENNRGRGAVYTIIQGQDSVNAFYEAAVAGSDGGRISGFTIKAEDDSRMRYGVFAEYESFVIENNDFRDTWGGVWVAGTGDFLIQNNSFTTSDYSIQAHADGSATIQYNVSYLSSGIMYISGEGQINVYGNSFDQTSKCAIQVNIGSPLIDSNTFTGRYSLLTGAIQIRNTTSPMIRRNDFIVDLSPCIYIYHDAAPDLGTTVDPGENVFRGNSGVAIHHSSVATVEAIGNTWYSTPPDCGTEIIVDSSGVIVWGSDFGESCP